MLILMLGILMLLVALQFLQRCFLKLQKMLQWFVPPVTSHRDPSFLDQLPKKNQNKVEIRPGGYDMCNPALSQRI